MEIEDKVKSFKIKDLEQDQQGSSHRRWKSARVWLSHLMDLLREADRLDKAWVQKLAQENNTPHIVEQLRILIDKLSHLVQWAKMMPWKEFLNMHHHPIEKRQVLLLNFQETQLIPTLLQISTNTFNHVVITILLPWTRLWNHHLLPLIFQWTAEFQLCQHRTHLENHIKCTVTQSVMLMALRGVKLPQGQCQEVLLLNLPQSINILEEQTSLQLINSKTEIVLLSREIVLLSRTIVETTEMPLKLTWAPLASHRS